MKLFHIAVEFCSLHKAYFYYSIVSVSRTYQIFFSIISVSNYFNTTSIILQLECSMNSFFSQSATWQCILFHLFCHFLMQTTVFSLQGQCMCEASRNILYIYSEKMFTVSIEYVSPLQIRLLYPILVIKHCLAFQGFQCLLLSQCTQFPEGLILCGYLTVTFLSLSNVALVLSLNFAVFSRKLMC